VGILIQLIVAFKLDKSPNLTNRFLLVITKIKSNEFMWLSKWNHYSFYNSALKLAEF